jgi:hypothetical protein
VGGDSGMGDIGYQLEEAGSSMEKVLKVSILRTDLIVRSFDCPRYLLSRNGRSADPDSLSKNLSGWPEFVITRPHGCSWNLCVPAKG